MLWILQPRRSRSLKVPRGDAGISAEWEVSALFALAGSVRQACLGPRPAMPWNGRNSYESRSLRRLHYFCFETASLPGRAAQDGRLLEGGELPFRGTNLSLRQSSSAPAAHGGPC